MLNSLEPLTDTQREILYSNYVKELPTLLFSIGGVVVIFVTSLIKSM